MKKPIMWVAALLTASCTPALKVEVANTTPTERDDETVEIAWSEVAALKGVTPDNIVVLNDDNEQIPSQVLFRGGTEPQALIFQTDADPMETKRFKIVTGVRENSPAEAYGRTVPERYDDYAWENNKVAYRLYGPALETSPEKLVTPGIDVWVKCTDKLVIDEWYARGKYHHNFGDGMEHLNRSGFVPFIRETVRRNVPFLGICLGMQCAVIEFARDVCGMADADSTEFNPSTAHPVIALMEEQKNITDKGGTMRLGAYPCILAKNSKAETAYGTDHISERHRHRYEFNSDFRAALEAKGLKITGTSPDGSLVEMVEIESHPWFVACQFHPEFKSTPLEAHPLFKDFIKAAMAARG